jgi:hypothetical protein
VYLLLGFSILENGRVVHFGWLVEGTWSTIGWTFRARSEVGFSFYYTIYE